MSWGPWDGGMGNGGMGTQLALHPWVTLGQHQVLCGDLGGWGGVMGIAGMGTVEEMSTEGRRGDGDTAGMTAAVCRRVSSPQFPFTTARALPLLAAPWMPALQPHHSPPGRGGIRRIRALQPPTNGSESAVHRSPLCGPAAGRSPTQTAFVPRSRPRGGPGGDVGGGTKGQRCPVLIPSPFRGRAKGARP